MPASRVIGLLYVSSFTPLVRAVTTGSHRSHTAMMRLLAVLLACSSAVATTPPSNPARRPAPMLHRVRQLSVGFAREAQDVVGLCVNPQEPVSVSVTEALMVVTTALGVQVLAMYAVSRAIAPRVTEFIFMKALNGCAMSPNTFALVFCSINSFISGAAGGLAGPTTFLLCILLLRVFHYARPPVTAKPGHLGPPPITSLGRLRGGDCTNEAWLHLAETVRMLSFGWSLVSVIYLLYLLHKSVGDQGLGLALIGTYWVFVFAWGFNQSSSG